MRKALVQGSRIVQVADVEFPVAAGLNWIDVPDEASTAWTFDGENAVRPPPEDLDEVKQEVIDRIENAASRRLHEAKGSLTDQALFQAYLEEVRQFDADGSPDPADYPLLAARAAFAGGTLSQVRNAVANRNANWKARAAQLETVRLTVLNAIANATTVQQVRNIEAAIPWQDDE